MILDNTDSFPNTAAFLREAGRHRSTHRNGPHQPVRMFNVRLPAERRDATRHKGRFEVRSGIVQQGPEDH